MNGLRGVSRVVATFFRTLLVALGAPSPDPPPTDIDTESELRRRR